MVRARRYAQKIMRRGLIMGLALIALSLSLQSTQKPVAFSLSKDIKGLIQATHLTRSLIVEGGALRLDPPSSAPTLQESRVLALWQSKGLGGYGFVADPVVFLASATLNTVPRGTPTGFSPPTFASRLAWVVAWENSGVTSCPDHPGTATRFKQRAWLEMVAADGSGQGVTFNTSGTVCGYPERAYAYVATYGLSVPWTIISTQKPRCHGTSRGCGRLLDALVRISLPRCAMESGSSTGGGGGQPSTLEVFVAVPMVGRGCSETKDQIIHMQVAANPVPPVTGLMQNYRTHGKTLTYFDGGSHTLRFSS